MSQPAVRHPPDILVVPKLRMNTRGPVFFLVGAPQLWNDLPEDIKLAGSAYFFNTLTSTDRHLNALVLF